MKEFEKYEAIEYSIESLVEQVKNEGDTLRKNKAPKELMEKVSEFYKFIKGYDVEQLRPKAETLTGELFDADKLIDKITKHTGYIWKVKEIKSDKALTERFFSKKDFKDQFNLQVDIFKVFEFNRDTNNRSDLSCLQLVLFPGCAFITYSTGRVDGQTDLCDSPAKLLKELENHCG